MTRVALLLLTVFSLFLAPACSPLQPNAPQPDTGKLNVVATTTLVAEFASRVGGEHVIVTALIPAETDPHTFEPTPLEVARLNEADLILINGAGLEANLESVLDSLTVPVVSVSEGIELLEGAHAEEEIAENDEHGEEEGDPHVWMSPVLVRTWVENIKTAYISADPANKTDYATRAAVTDSELVKLDAWVAEQAAQIPVENRLLVSDHNMLSYFAAQYGFEVAGAVIESFSTSAEPSAQELAALSDMIRERGVRAIFVDRAANPDLSQQLAEDLGIKVVVLFNGSLTDASGEAPDYFSFIRFNTNAIVDALK